MARTKGALNKQKGTLKTIQLNKYIENTPIVNSESCNEWVTWGQKNNFPTILLDLYHNSPTHSACVEFIVNAIIGKGINYEAIDGDTEELVPNYLEDWNELLTKVALDLVLFGGYAIQVLPNRGEGYTFYHQPFSTVRFGKKNEDGEITKAYLCKDWTQTSKFKPIEIDVLNTTDDVIKTTKGKPYLMVYTSYNPFDEYYPQPKYSSALNAIKADCELQNYDLNSIQNLFTPSGMLTLNRCEDENERRTILKNIESMFSGSDNAGRILISFRTSDDDAPIQFTPFVANEKGVNLFSDTSMRNINRIVTAHHIASKTLIGVNLDGNGFASEADVMESAYNLTEKLTIASFRKKIVNTMNVVFKLNGIDQTIELIPLSFNLVGINDTNINSRDKIDEVDKITNPSDEQEQLQ